MDDLISRQAAISAICNACGKIDCDKMDKCEKLQLPPANCSEFPNNSDTISRQAAIDAVKDWYDGLICGSFKGLKKRLEALPSAQPEQRYTEEELRVFQHGISLSLLSKRSSQHWQYDEDTATEIKFLERLYEKVGADIRSEHDG